MTHAISGTLDEKLANNQAAYSHENTLRLALEDPNKARNNADNYQYLALAAYFNSSTWSIDPNNLTPGPVATGSQPSHGDELLAMGGSGGQGNVTARSMRIEAQK